MVCRDFTLGVIWSRRQKPSFCFTANPGHHFSLILGEVSYENISGLSILALCTKKSGFVLASLQYSSVMFFAGTEQIANFSGGQNRPPVSWFYRFVVTRHFGCNGSSDFDICGRAWELNAQQNKATNVWCPVRCWSGSHSHKPWKQSRKKTRVFSRQGFFLLCQINPPKETWENAVPSDAKKHYRAV